MIVKKRLILPYTAEQMYALVNAIESYPAFLPYCHSTVVYTRSTESVKAKICLAKGGVSYAFTTSNKLQKNQQIEIELIEGPFKTLHGVWQFVDLPAGGSTVEVEISFSFRSKLMAFSIGPFIPLISDKVLEAFTSRAKELYAS